MKISLKTPMFLNGHRYNPGDVVDLPPGAEGPYDSNGPAFEVIDEESWNERAALTAKHAKEREELAAPDRKREALLHKQAEESAELRRKHAEKELVRKHEREAADLEAQHKAQAEALKSREPEHVAVPRETSEAQLGERHKVEAEELAKRQEAEKKALAEEHKEAEERKAEAEKQRNAPPPDRTALESQRPAPRAPVPPPVYADEEPSMLPRSGAVSQGRPMTDIRD